jgi:cell pole-organizing protein PopZ
LTRRSKTAKFDKIDPSEKADTMRQAGEPTVEEILESIKKVIARDSRSEAEEGQHRPAVAVTADANDEGGVLELTENSELLEQEGAGEDAGGAPLINADAQASMRDSLAALSLLSEPGAQPRIVRSGETSLEDMVREMLRPALADWLDKNLPPLVERMVAAEIRRIAGKKG